MMMHKIKTTQRAMIRAAFAAALLLLGWTNLALGAPWTPVELPQPPALWLDASDLSASPVSAWNDKSGNSRNFAQATGANQPAYSATSFNGKPGVTFDGSDFMSAGDTLDMRTSSLTVMSAVRYATGNNSGTIIAKTRYAGGAGRWTLYRTLTGSTFGSGTQYDTVLQPDFLPGAILQVANSSTSARINGFVLDRSTSGSCKIWDNGTNTASATFTGNTTDFNSTDELWIGAYQGGTGTTPPTGGSYLNGVIAEVVVVQTAMSDADRWKLEGYLAWKWGMQANLPANHPYKSAAPEANDTTPPTVATLSPTDDATGVLTYANLSATFNEGIQKGTGNITLKKSADNSTVETFDVATSPRITVSGATLTIDPTANLEATTGYYVQIGATAVKDMANNSFAGIADTTTWNFTTGAPWTPADLLPLPALWLDASDLSASPVSAWNDKSGNSRNFAQATGANQPAYSATSFNGKPGVTFDGSSDFMSAGDTLDMRTSSLTVMSAVRYATGTDSGVIIAKTRAGGQAGRWVLYRATSGGGLGSGPQYNTVLQEGVLPGVVLQVADSSTSAKINGFVLDRSTSGSCKIWDNGTNTASATFTGNTTDFDSNDQLWIGAYQSASGTTPPSGGYLNGVIAEVVVVQTAMSDADRWKLEGYLAWKWGMQANLPADHPYMSAAPESSDTTPPTVATLSPTDDATGVLTYANLSATFNDIIQKGTGNITLKKSADNSTVETFDVATSPRVTVSGATLTINPTSNLEGNTGYYVEIAATAVKDLANNAFAGIADTTTWNFTTGVADTTAPAISTLSPADGDTGADRVANLVATFDENIQKGTGFITLKKSADNSEVETFDVATSPQVTVSGATLTINPTANLAFATGYYVQIDPTAIQDLSGNSFAGIADSTTWNFTTRAIVLYDDFAVNPNLSSGLWTHSYAFGNFCGTPAWNSGTEDLTLGLPTSGGTWSLLRRTDATRGATDPVTLQIKSLSKSGTDWGQVGLSISAEATFNNIWASTPPRYLFLLITDNGTDWKYQLRRDANNTLWTSSTFTLASLVFPIRLDAVRNGDNYDFKVNGSTVVTGSFYTSAQHDSLVYYHMTWGIGYSSAMTAKVDNFGIPPPLQKGTIFLIR